MRTRTLFALRAVLPPTVGLLVAACITDESTPLPPAKDAGTQDGSVKADGGNGADGGKPAIDLGASRIDFGLQDCGSIPASKTFTFKNTGSAALTYSAKLQTGTAFTLSGAAEGTVAPGSVASVTLSANAVPTNVAAATVLADQIVVVTNVPGLERVEVPVALTTQGGTLQLTSASTSFGQVQLTVQADDLPFELKNTGNKAVDVSVTNPANTDYSSTWTGAPDAVSVAPGAVLAGAAARFKPTTVGVATATYTAAATGALCQPAPATLAVTGEGVAAQVLVSPVPIDFATTPCGATAPSKVFQIKNGYSFPISYTATFGRQAQSSSPYVIPVGSSGTVPANGSVDVTINALPVKKEAPSLVANALDDTLIVASTNAPGFTQTTVAVTQKASGAILGIAMPATDFTNVTVGSTGSLPFTVTNTGNVDANVAVATTTTGGGTVFQGGLVGQGDVVPATTGTRTGAATFVPTANGAKTGTVALTTTTPLCQASLPAAIDVKGVGVGPVAVFPAAPASVDAICGTPPSESISYTITNAGTAPLTVSASVTGPFVLGTTTPQTAAPGGTVTLTITPTAPVIGTDRGGTTKTGGLVVVTNERGGTTYPAVPLKVAVHGANLETVSSSSTTAPVITSLNLTAAACPANQKFSIRNSGDLTANAAQGNSPQFFSVFGGAAFTPAPVAPGGFLGPYTVQVFSTTGVCTGTSAVTFLSNAPAGSGICIDLTTPLSLTWSRTDGSTACYCS